MTAILTLKGRLLPGIPGPPGPAGPAGPAGTAFSDSAGLRALLSDETGTGAAVFANTPTLVTPVLGAATATSVVASGLVQAGTTLGISTDALFHRDDAGIFAQRNGVNAQTFQIYNTFTDASNYERARIGWNSNTFAVVVQSAGTGTMRTAVFGNDTGTSWRVDGSGNANVHVAAVDRVRVDSTSTAGNTALLLWDVDNGTLERVTVGAADSGGVGFKVLRIPN